MKAADLVARVKAVEKKLRSRAGVFDVRPMKAGPKLTAPQLAQLEKKLGHELPPLLRDVYTTVGRELAFYWQFKPGKGETFGCDDSGLLPWGALELSRPFVESEAPYVRIGGDANGRCLALHYAKRGKPLVVDYDHEEVEESHERARDIDEYLRWLSSRGFMHIEDDTEELERFFAKK